MYKIQRRLYSQNNLVSQELVAKLVGKSSIGKSDTVVEIGPGRGIITHQLVTSAEKVIAVEVDKVLYRGLKAKFRSVTNLEIINADFLQYCLPRCPYNVFANIPFVITADVIRKLTSDSNFQEGFLLVQKEAAQKLIGMPFDSRNQMLATLLKPWFDISVFWQFIRADFIPRPNVDTVMLKISRKTNPLIARSSSQNYRDFIVYSYNRNKIARLSFNTILRMFQKYVQSVGITEKKLVAFSARKILKDQSTLHKIHRSRTAKNWRKF